MEQELQGESTPLENIAGIDKSIGDIQKLREHLQINFLGVVTVEYVATLRASRLALHLVFWPLRKVSPSYKGGGRCA